jgi:hypothetical protein
MVYIYIYINTILYIYSHIFIDAQGSNDTLEDLEESIEKRQIAINGINKYIYIYRYEFIYIYVYIYIYTCI